MVYICTTTPSLNFKNLNFTCAPTSVSRSENLFGYLKAQLLQHLTKTLQQLRRQVRKLFNDLPDHYLAELAGSMRRRMKQVIFFGGEATKY